MCARCIALCTRRLPLGGLDALRPPGCLLGCWVRPAVFLVGVALMSGDWWRRLLFRPRIRACRSSVSRSVHEDIDGCTRRLPFGTCGPYAELPVETGIDRASRKDAQTRRCRSSRVIPPTWLRKSVRQLRRRPRLSSAEPNGAPSSSQVSGYVYRVSRQPWHASEPPPYLRGSPLLLALQANAHDSLWRSLYAEVSRDSREVVGVRIN